MRLAVLGLLLIALAGCTRPAVGGALASGGTNDLGKWSYVKGPHGENCLFWTYNLGSTVGDAAMSCDKVIP